MNPDQLEDIVIEDIEMDDYPDFSNAFIASASFNGRDLTDDELDAIQNNYPGWVNEKAHEAII